MSAKSEKWFGIIMVILILIPILGIAITFLLGLLPYIIVGLAFSDFSPVTKTLTKRGEYYRITARYLVDDVEPLSFDIVAACGYNGFDPSKHWGRNGPALYGKKTRGNHAVILSVPDFCSDVASRKLGQIGGNFDGSFLPLTVWIDNANDMTVGLGYASIYAFDNPSARLSFVEANVRYATREEFEDWHEFRDTNLFKSDLSRPSFETDVRQSGSSAPVIPDRCYGIGFVHGNAAAQELLKKYWPKDHPKYWAAFQLSAETKEELRSELRKSEVAKFHMHDLEGETDKDLIGKVDWSTRNLRNGFSSLDRSKLSTYFKFEEKPTEHYPVYFYDTLSGTLSEPRSATRARIDLSPQMKGFVACYSTRHSPQPKSNRAIETANTKTSERRKPDTLLLDINGETELSTTDRFGLWGQLFVEDRSVGRLIEFSTARIDRFY